MCGRFTLRQSRQEIARAFVLLAAADHEPRYNIAPSQMIAAVRAATSAGAASERELVHLHWGLIPRWADDPAIGNRLINARAETIDTKPAFREAFRQRRCLVVADGFFEWQKEARRKQPFHIRLGGQQLFALAGVWERWQQADRAIESCAIITTTANRLVGRLHDRMPVILDPADYDLWLDPAVGEVERLKPLLRPCADDLLEMVPVHPRMNSPAREGAECVETFRPQRTLELFPDDE
jgi:putative SOS response-associated peptidase YedK